MKKSRARHRKDSTRKKRGRVKWNWVNCKLTDNITVRNDSNQKRDSLNNLTLDRRSVKRTNYISNCLRKKRTDWGENWIWPVWALAELSKNFSFYNPMTQHALHTTHHRRGVKTIFMYLNMPRWSNFGILNSLTPRRKISPVIWSAQPAALSFLKVYSLDWLILILSCVKPNDRPVREVERPSRITQDLARDPTFLLHASALCNFFRSIQVWDFFLIFEFSLAKLKSRRKEIWRLFFGLARQSGTVSGDGGAAARPFIRLGDFM